MASLYISCFGGQDKGVAIDPKQSEALTTSSTSAASGALKGKYIKLQSADAHWVYLAPGTVAATATNGSYLAANEILWLAVPNDTYKVNSRTVA